MLKRTVQRFLGAFGYRVVMLEAAQPTWRLTHFFPLLQRFGFRPRHSWDVGANRGDWTRASVRYFPDVEYTVAMDAYGYRLLDITDLHRGPSQGVLWLCEFAFLRKNSQLFEQARY